MAHPRTRCSARQLSGNKASFHCLVSHCCCAERQEAVLCDHDHPGYPDFLHYLRLLQRLGKSADRKPSRRRSRECACLRLGHRDHFSASQPVIVKKNAWETLFFFVKSLINKLKNIGHFNEASFPGSDAVTISCREHSPFAGSESVSRSACA